MFIVTLVTLLTVLPLILHTQAQQVVSSPDGRLWQCPSTQTIEVAYISYCPALSRTNGALLGASSIGHSPNSPANYNSVAGDFVLICDYAPGISCNYRAGAGQPLVIASGQNANCPAPPSSVPQPSPGVNYKREEMHMYQKRYDTKTRFTCPRTSTGGQYLKYNQVSNGSRGGATGYLYDCVWEGGGLSPDTRCTYDVTGATITYQNQGINRCPTTLCTAIKTGTNNLRRRGAAVFDERAEMVRGRQVDTGVLRRRQAGRRAARDVPGGK